MRSWNEGSQDVDASPATEGGLPGRRSLTDRLPVQLRALPGSPGAAPIADAAWSAVRDDPFGLHLPCGPVQRRAGGDTGAGGVDVGATAAAGVAGTGGSLPFLDTIQRSFGRHDVGGVRAHTDGAAASAASAIGASAYATGNAVAFAGAPDLHTAAHEAAHVVQQRAGVHLKGGVGEVGDVYERHADEVADAVVAGRSAEALLDRHAGGSGGGGAVQLKKDVFSTVAFADPVKYLQGDSKQNKVVEEPGAQGILGAPDQTFIKYIAKSENRDKLIDQISDKMNADTESKRQADLRAMACSRSHDTAGELKASSESKECETRIAILGKLITGLAAIEDTDLESAAEFYRQNTLALSKVNALPKKVHQKGDSTDDDHKAHTYHKDAGLIVVDASTLHGSPSERRDKAALLNGPFGTGFVRGHNTIKNMKHRFIDHIHVDKDDETNGMDIYNTNKATDGEAAEAWIEKANQADEGLHGNDTKAINTQIGAANDADVATLKSQNPTLVKTTEE
ncbi:MAG TPA: DUF4157 domain-containing protein [Kofleriaceae bacterium]|nr:DUF4157 domain-containing protein [Kofleriaceae bacterium]